MVKIFVVDDLVLMCGMVVFILCGVGYEVSEVENG